MSDSIDLVKSQSDLFSVWLDNQKEGGNQLSASQNKAIQAKTSLLSLSTTITNDMYQTLLDNIDSDVQETSLVETGESTPTLVQPRTSTKELAKSAKILRILATVSELCSEVGLSQLSAKLNGLLSAYRSNQALSEQTSKEIDNLIVAAEQATDELNSATETLNSLQQQLNSANNDLTEKENELNSLEEGAEEYQELLDAYQKAKDTVTNLTQKILDQKNIVNTKTTAANQALQKASQAYEQANLTISNNTSVTTEDTKKELSRSAKMALLIAQFMQLVNENSETELKNQLALFESLQTSLQQKMEDQAKEIEEQERKAAELQKTMGCLAKIIGAVITAVSVVSAVFTGGASLALAAVGIALMATDYIMEATTGQSLTDRIMAPFMEYVFLPLMNAIQSILDDVLEYTIIGQLINLISDISDYDIKDIAKTAIAAATTIAVIIAVAFVAKSAVKTIAEKLINSVVLEAIKELVPKIAADVVKQVAKTVASTIRNTYSKIGLNSKSTAQNALKVQKLTQLLSFGNQVSQVTGDVVVAEFRIAAAKAAASFKMAQAQMEIIKEILQRVIGAFQNSQEIYRDIAKLVSESINKETTTGKEILHNLRV